MRPASKGRPWSHDELVVACNLYFTLPFGQMHARNPSVIALAGALGRTPSSIAMKLVNFASLDPTHQARGVSGLKGVSRMDKEVWQEFRANWPNMASESERLLEGLLTAAQKAVRKKAGAAEILLPAPTQPTERTANVQVRVMQSFFRKAVLAAYGWQCCVTGNPVPQLLIASHILPWGEFPEQRLNPCNGLCLAAHLDRAFDSGLITFSNDMQLVLSSRLRAYLPNQSLQREFVSIEGSPLRMPERFQPSAEFVEYHRQNIFRP